MHKYQINLKYNEQGQTLNETLIQALKIELKKHFPQIIFDFNSKSLKNIPNSSERKVN